VIPTPLPTATPSPPHPTFTPIPSATTTLTPVATLRPTSSATPTGLVLRSPTQTPPATAAGPGPTAAWIGFVGVVIAALLVASWNIWLARRRSREEERSRQRTAFAEAFKAYGRYKELPYAIRHRSLDDPAAERVRLSEIAREIQAELTYHQTWMDLESDNVATAYRNLVAELHKVAGGHMREAWTLEAITTDAQMNMVIDMAMLAELEGAYLAAVRAHLEELAPWWCR
jgi:hypothetical protein